jgi:hypothetical protein
MAANSHLSSEGMLAASPRVLLDRDGRWPISRVGLTALLDLGMTNAQIGAYFAVGPDEVGMLREHYRLIRGASK